MSDKKKEQLGMNPSTASYKLTKDILWALLVQTNQNLCYKCNLPMTRETFSIEHIIPWLDSSNPLELYFDLKNISFSHLTCNIADRRTTNPSQCGTLAKYTNGKCRCDSCKNIWNEYKRSKYSPEKRKDKYKRLGS